MNPLTNVKNIKKLSERELKLGSKSSWHDQYKDSAWVFIGGLPYDLTEGDIICVFSQYGEVVHINLVRDRDTGKQKGYCFLCYEDQRSTILAVDNLNGIKILGRTLRVDHVENYKTPKESKKNPIDDETKQLREEGCAPTAIIPQPPIVNDNSIKNEEIVVGGIKLPPRLPIVPLKTEENQKQDENKKQKEKKSKKKNKKKDKKNKKEKKSKKRKRKHSTSSSDSESSSSSSSSSNDDSKRKRKNK